MIDDRTEHLSLALPHTTNALKLDVLRIREALAAIDGFIFSGFATGFINDYAFSTPPNAAWRMCYGQALLAGDTDAAALRAKLIADGNPYGVDGSGNPRVPDFRGRGAAGKDDMGGTAAGRLTTAGSGIDGTKLGAAGGAETHLLVIGQVPAHNHGVSDPGHNHAISDPGHTHTVSDPTHAHGVYDPGHAHIALGSKGTSDGAQYVSIDGISNDVNSQTTSSGTGIGIYGAATGISIVARATGITVASKVTGITTLNAGSGQAHNNTQPTLVVNKIIKL